jgi:hypothetical protein
LLCATSNGCTSDVNLNHTHSQAAAAVPRKNAVVHASLAIASTSLDCCGVGCVYIARRSITFRTRSPCLVVRRDCVVQAAVMHTPQHRSICIRNQSLMQTPAYGGKRRPAWAPASCVGNRAVRCRNEGLVCRSQYVNAEHLRDLPPTSQAIPASPPTNGRVQLSPEPHEPSLGPYVSRPVESAGNAQLPYLLYIPDLDGVGLTAKRQWQSLAEAFDLYTVKIPSDDRSSLADIVSSLKVLP